MSEIKKENKIKKIILEYLPYILVIIGIILIKQFVVAPIKVNGDSMNKTLRDGDIMILNRLDYKFGEIKRFDVIVIDDGEEYIIKRVIGLPNETVSYVDNELFVDGKKVDETYGYGNTRDFEVKVPKNKYFVLGDNRENSMDSRHFGAFSNDTILGRAKLVIFPFSRFGNKK